VNTAPPKKLISWKSSYKTLALNKCMVIKHFGTPNSQHTILVALKHRFSTVFSVQISVLVDYSAMHSLE